MRTTVELFADADFSVSAVTCRDDHVRWSAPEEVRAHRVVLVRRGAFRRRSPGGAAEPGVTAGYVTVPGEEEQFAHPAGGDVCTAVWISPAAWRSVAGEEGARSVLYVDAAVDLTHRRLLNAGAGRAGDVSFAVAEELVGLVASAVRGPRPDPPPSPADRRLVAHARAAVEADHPAASGLVPLAASLGVSPYRLSRAFSRATGVPLTRFRNRLRVGRALDRLEQGASDLAGLAADLGFADQAHLTRTVRRHTGHTPAAIRRLLAPPAGGHDPAGRRAEP